MHHPTSPTPNPTCATTCSAGTLSSADTLNRDCFCTTLNRNQLDQLLKADALNLDVLNSHPQLFSNTSVFISPAQVAQMQELIHTLERVIQLPAYQQQVLAKACDTARYDGGVAGVFMGYDFHMDAGSPQLIEINTNAGGGFLNSALLRAQTACCRANRVELPRVNTDIDEQFVAMFRNEWRSKRGDKPLQTLAIVDEQPSQQFLYPEFKMAQRLFEKHGLHCLIADPAELIFIDGQLFMRGENGAAPQAIDLVYNRLTDFTLDGANCSALRAAWLADAVVLTPNPRLHALFANKFNLTLFSDADHLQALGASAEDSAILQNRIPRTVLVTADIADELWRERKNLFFKPLSGFGSRATYRGDKLTKRVWESIVQGDYVAQRAVAPSERGMLVDGQEIALKMDIRAYAYQGEIQLLAARLYQGQTTNFRTQGGGFAPVFISN